MRHWYARASRQGQNCSLNAGSNEISLDRKGYSTLRTDSQKKKRKHVLKHGFEICLHTLRGTISLSFTGSSINNIASRKTEVFLASAMYS